MLNPNLSLLQIFKMHKKINFIPKLNWRWKHLVNTGRQTRSYAGYMRCPFFVAVDVSSVNDGLMVGCRRIFFVMPMYVLSCVFCYWYCSVEHSGVSIIQQMKSKWTKHGTDYGISLFSERYDDVFSYVTFFTLLVYVCFLLPFL